MISKFKYPLLIAFIGFSALSFNSSNDLQSIESKYEFFSPIIEKLYEEGVDSSFIKNFIEHSSVRFDEKYVKINVTGYLTKPDYSKHYNARSVKKSKKFLSEYISILEEAEKKFGVQKEVITSVLWVETRHGGYLGNNHIPTVFISTAMADQEEFIEMNTEIFKETFSEDSEKRQEYEDKVIARAKRKSNWALKELVALSKIYSERNVDIYNIKGSWAGAFGMSQFLPSSFLNWAVDGDGDGEIDLFTHHDAIYSVANYLKTNGWGKTEKQQRAAVYHYNHSNDYVDAVLKLADLIKA